MRHITANTAREDFNHVLESVTRFNEPVAIVSDDDKVAVMVSMEEWRGIQETIYLQTIPGMVDSIKTAAAESLTDGIAASEVDFGA
jgi:prevent-host-death family protein